uniref:MONALYSIN n=1 Tax=Pseudomonas entomophila (strain L48) TaxID=384676 RepID=UPI0005CF9297|nr:Chain A, MONALYSIN [Pseudomonas entomophila L48]4MKQ_B Chain B, MONALYSIN [Pseudomonas entomophila L48]
SGRFDQYPTKKGDFAIDGYLLDYSSPKQGCWVDGITVYGDIYIGKQNWGTYTRPVFAYLQYVETISGSGTFVIYQVVLVYAHNATSAGRQNANAFAYSKTQAVGSRVDLYYLSAITQRKRVIVPSSNAVTPLDWDTVQRNVLMENYNPGSNSGHFSFDWSAYNDPHRRY